MERDSRWDGRLFFGVRTTGVFCRPVCPARRARAANVEYFGSAAAAVAAGYRACLRCRPDQAPPAPSAEATGEDPVSRALELIDGGALDDDGDVTGLAQSVGVGERRLRRLFRAAVGASPVQVASSRRLLLSRRLLTSSDAPVIDVAYASGFASLRRFNEAFRQAHGEPPRELRRRWRAAEPVGSTENVAGEDLALEIGVREPFAAGPLLAFLAARAIPGVERVEGTGVADGSAGTYRRTFRLGGGHHEQHGEEHDEEKASGRLTVTAGDVSSAPGAALRVAIRFHHRAARLPSLVTLVERVKHLFDAGWEPQWIEPFRSDPVLGPLWAACPGVRVPGCFDPFELGVRAILGQQVTVRGATTLCGRLVERWGSDLGGPDEEPDRLFPRPEDLCEAPLEEIGLPRTRAATLRAFAELMCARPDLFSGGLALDELRRRLLAIRGIGPWTAEYLAMRGVHDRDAFPSGDLVLRKRLADDHGDLPSVREVEEAARPWSPHRAYAAMLLWRGLRETNEEEEPRVTGPVASAEEGTMDRHRTADH